MAVTLTQREEHDARKRAINDAMMPFVKQSDFAHQMKWQYERIEAIVDGCRSLERDGDYWEPEFLAGTDISDACRTAWKIHCHTGMSVRFTFNGVEIQMDGLET